MKPDEIGIEQHAVLYALLARNTCKAFGEEQGREMMRIATRAYGRQRGRRMAENAVRAGRPKDMTSFFLCGEWKGREGENVSEMKYKEDSTYSFVHKCAWHDAWQKYGIRSYGSLYCLDIDDAICEGFAGSFGLQVEQAIGKGDDCCIFHWSEGTDTETLKELRKTHDHILPFSFHCKELAFCVYDTLRQADPAAAAEIIAKTKAEFEDLYGRETGTIFPSLI
ncbi:MAG: L-2-amino-thiazoline-4-carboxylic acid hydrolase [Solobacterium sp.]|nr:L-2-amino-thiazoline-4-carboxylic acid hydrolase [Solobacterium sp.]